jgi:hypothetical protein
MSSSRRQLRRRADRGGLAIRRALDCEPRPVRALFVLDVRFLMLGRRLAGTLPADFFAEVVDIFLDVDVFLEVEPLAVEVAERFADGFFLEVVPDGRFLVGRPPLGGRAGDMAG